MGIFDFARVSFHGNQGLGIGHRGAAASFFNVNGFGHLDLGYKCSRCSNQFRYLGSEASVLVWLPLNFGIAKWVRVQHCADERSFGVGDGRPKYIV